MPTPEEMPSPDEIAMAAMPEPTIHELKCWPIYYRALLAGEKTFEVRINDRGFQKGDILREQEYNPSASAIEHERFTGRETDFEVTYVLQGGQFGIASDHCVMAVKLRLAKSTQ